MSYETDLLQGLAQRLEDQGVGVYRSDGSAYADEDTAVVFGQMPDKPHRCVSLATYPLTDEPREALSMVAVNIRARGLPRDYLDAVNLGDAVFQAVHGLTGVQYGTCWVIQILRRTSVPMGTDPIDPHHRWEISSNYYADVNPPTSTLRPE